MLWYIKLLVRSDYKTIDNVHISATIISGIGDIVEVVSNGCVMISCGFHRGFIFCSLTSESKYIRYNGDFDA